MNEKIINFFDAKFSKQNGRVDPKFFAYTSLLDQLLKDGDVNNNIKYIKQRISFFK